MYIYVRRKKNDRNFSNFEPPPQYSPEKCHKWFQTYFVFPLRLRFHFRHIRLATMLVILKKASLIDLIQTLIDTNTLIWHLCAEILDWQFYRRQFCSIEASWHGEITHRPCSFEIAFELINAYFNTFFVFVFRMRAMSSHIFASYKKHHLHSLFTKNMTHRTQHVNKECADRVGHRIINSSLKFCVDVSARPFCRSFCALCERGVDSAKRLMAHRHRLIAHSVNEMRDDVGANKKLK